MAGLGMVRENGKLCVTVDGAVTETYESWLDKLQITVDRLSREMERQSSGYK